MQKAVRNMMYRTRDAMNDAIKPNGIAKKQESMTETQQYIRRCDTV